MEHIRQPKPDQETQSAPRTAQARFAAGQSALAAAIDNSPRMVAQRQKLQSLFGNAAQRQAAAEEEPLQGRFAVAQRAEEEEPVQGKFADPPNHTGLPNQLKAGIESLSGLSMDNVRVHYNSPRPAQLNAHAYTQGHDIHVAAGQERHLPHEAWHVVQQAQGRVRPTMQMKGGVAVNDDPGLEREADVMGSKAVQMKALNAAPYLSTSLQHLPGQVVQKLSDDEFDTATINFIGNRATAHLESSVIEYHLASYHNEIQLGEGRRILIGRGRSEMWKWGYILYNCTQAQNGRYTINVFHAHHGFKVG